MRFALLSGRPAALFSGRPAALLGSTRSAAWRSLTAARRHAHAPVRRASHTLSPRDGSRVFGSGRADTLRHPELLPEGFEQPEPGLASRLAGKVFG